MLLGLSVLAGVLCIGTGVAWMLLGEVVGSARFVLLTLALLGSSAFLAGGFWQWRAGPKTRVFVLVLVAVLAAAYVFASVVAVIATEEGVNHFDAGGVRLWHQAGLVMGGLLYVAALVEGFGALRARDRSLNGAERG